MRVVLRALVLLGLAAGTFTAACLDNPAAPSDTRLIAPTGKTTATAAADCPPGDLEPCGPVDPGGRRFHFVATQCGERVEHRGLPGLLDPWRRRR